MENNEMKYEKAVSELEEIVDKMERDELDIDQLSEQLKRAKVLVKLCKDKLTKTDEEIKKLLNEDCFPKMLYSGIKMAKSCPKMV